MGMAKGKADSVVHKALPVFYMLRQCSPRTCKSILRDKHLSFIFQAIHELVYNYLFGDPPLTKKQKLTIKKKLRLLRKVVKEKRLASLHQIVLRNRKTLLDIILEPVETSLREMLQQQ